MTTSDARKRNAETVVFTRTDGQPVRGFTHPADAGWINPPRFTIPAHVFTQEDTMTDQPEPYDFHDEAERALLNDNLAPGEQASLHALFAIHDTLKVLAGNSAEQHATLTEIRDRLPEPEREEAFVEMYPAVVGYNLRHWKPGVHTTGVDCSCGPEKVPHAPAHNHGPAQGRGLDCPEREDGHGHLRGACMVEAAPREDEDPDEALARVACSAFWGGQVMPSADNADWKNVARAAREYIVAEMDKCYAKEDATAHDRAEKAEAERDALRERLDALRADLRADRLMSSTILYRDDERAAAIEAGGSNA